jgi:hypothetical protein
MTNREWLDSLSNEELGTFLGKAISQCSLCHYQDIPECSGNCEKGITKWLNKKSNTERLKQEYIEPMPTLQVGDIVQTRPYSRYVAIDPITLVKAKNIERVCLRDIGDIVQIWRLEGGEEYRCIWRADNE